MARTFRELLKQPYWIVTLIFGVGLVAAPCITVDKAYAWSTHPPTTLVPVILGMLLVGLSALVFSYALLTQGEGLLGNAGSGVRLERVKESKGTFSAKVGGCEIRVVTGKLEAFATTAGVAVVLPCNEYFDDRCVDDKRSALGAFINAAFDGQVHEFVSLMKQECQAKLGPGIAQQKTDVEQAHSFGTGRCLLLMRPLDRAVPVALISTTTQRAGHGLASRISYLFQGMSELVERLANERITEVVMPVLGSGHGGLDPSLAFVGLVSAIAEAARYGHGAQRLRKVTIVVFKRDTKSPAQVDRVVIQRALALVAT